MGSFILGKIKTAILPLLVGFFLVISFSRPAAAAINPQINFQGKLTNPDSTNVTNGTYSIVFSIYTVASGGSAVWTETHGSVSVADGIFRVALGSGGSALPGSVDFNNSGLYLGIKVGADAEMSPRVQFTSAPYAFNSDLLDGINSTGFIQLGLAAAQTDGTTNSSIFVNKTSTGNFLQLQSAATDVFAVTNAGNITLGQNANKTITVSQTATDAAGKSLTLTAGQGGTGAAANAGGDLVLQGGVGGGTNGNGGNILLSAGLPDGSGLAGTITVQNSANSTTAFSVKNAAGTSTPLAVDTVNNRVSIGGGLTINTTDNSIVRTSNADFTLGTIGSDLTNTTSPSGQLELSDGTIPNSGTGTITTAGQPAVDAVIGAGASAITRPDGKYLVLKGGSTLATSLYDSIAGTFTNSQTLVVGAGTVGVGSVVLPRASGMYVVVLGNGVVNTSNLDPSGVVTSTAGPSLTTAAGAGTVALKRTDGKYLVTIGGGAGTTNVYDPVANTFAAGPTNSGAVAWGIGALALPRPDGTALFITGGATSTTQIYNPSTANPSIGVFSGVGPSMDGSQATGTCGINNLGSVAIRRADGKYIVLSKAGVSTIYDPVANTFTCRSAVGPAAALGNGAHAIPLQNGTFLIIRGGATTTSYLYDPSADTFTAHGTVLSTITTGAFSLMRADGTWQVLAGASTTTNNYNTGLPMSSTTTTKYTSDDISTTSLNSSSVLRWTAQFESPYVGTNAATNTAFSAMQFFVRTAVDSGGCAAPLNAATDKEIASSGEFIRPVDGDNCIRITVQFNRPIPKRITDERGTWTGNSSTVLRLDYATPTLFDVSVDNSVALHRDGFNFAAPGSQSNNTGTIPSAPTSAAPSAGGACTAGNHFWFVTFVTSGSESRLSPASTVQNCTGPNGTVALSAIPIGPTGTTARKIYRTSSGKLVTDTAYLLTTLNDNSTVIFSDTIADGSLGAAYAQTEASGPVATRAEAVNGQLVLPYGRITPTTLAGTTQYYLGNTTAAHANLTQAQTNVGTIAIVRPNRTTVVIAALTAPAANASLYDPSTQTFAAQAGTSIPTAANGAGGFALRRPDGKFLVVLGNSSAVTNIYDADNNVFSAGPTLTGNAAVGASAIPNADGTYTIVHGGGLTTSTLYDPIRNTTITGPTLTTAANCGFWAIPLRNGMYKTFVGIASGVIGATTSMNYNPISKTFVAGTALTGAHGCGSFAFQRADGYWMSVAAAGGAAGAASALTSIIDPVAGNSIAGPALTNVAGLGARVVPRADGTYLIVSGSAATTTTIHIPYGGTFGVGASIGVNANGPVITAVGQGALSFQRPDGKWVIINGNATQTAQLMDVGWYADGQYLSEQMQVPTLAANSVLNWRQTSDFVRMEVRTASSQAALSTAPYKTVGRPGTSIGNSGGETWVQVEINFRRDFPTYSGILNGVYASGGGMAFPDRAVTLPTVMSYDINNGSDLLTLQNDGLAVFRVSSEGNIYSSSSGGFYSGGADLAENYTSSDSLVAGEVVSIDSANNHGVKRSTGQYQADVLGVVSTAPGFVAGAFTEDSYPVALVGRVPVKISTENGTIKQGDFLTAASIPGYAMKATVSGRVIGTALEDFVTSSLEDCPSLGAGNAISTQCGTVMMFVNLTNYQGSSIDALMQDDSLGQVVGNAYISGVDFPDVEGLIGDKQENILGFLKVLKARQAAGTAPVGSDIVTNRLSAVDEVISPVIIADIIRAKTIQATNIQGLEVYTNKVSSLADAYDGLKAQALVGAPPATNLSSVTFGSGTFSVSLVTLGTFEAKGGITVDGLSQFNGKTTFAALVEFMGKTNFNNDANFSGRVTFNKDAGGNALLKKGSTRVDVTFSNSYVGKPVVAVQLLAVPKSLANGENEDIAVAEQRLLAAGYSYIVSDVQGRGFTIVVNKPVTEDVLFSWTATAIKDAVTFTSTLEPAAAMPAALPEGQ